MVYVSDCLRLRVLTSITERVKFLCFNMTYEIENNRRAGILARKSKKEKENHRQTKKIDK